MRYFFFLLIILTPFISTASSYSVTPPVIEHEVEARDILEDSIKITNTDVVPVKIFPSVHIITLGDIGEIKTFESPVMTDQTRNVTSWIAVSRARIELAPGESIKIPVTLTVNPNAVPGDYYAFIGFGSGDKRDEAEALVLAGRAPGVTMRVSLADKKNEYVRLHSFSVDRYIASGQEVVITYKLENIGDTPITPRGEIILYDVRGNEVAAVPVNEAGQTVSPKETVTFEAKAPDTGVFGRHKAFLNLEYGTMQRANVYDTTFFTVVPIRLLIILFVGLLVVSLVLTLLYLYRRQRTQPHEDDMVSLYVRDGVHSNLKDHDINLKHN